MKKLCAWIALILTLTTGAALAAENVDAVTVNGEIIYQSEVESLMESFSSQAGQYGLDVTDESVLSIIQSAAMDELINDRLLAQDMTRLGFYEFTEAELAEIHESAYLNRETLTSEYLEYYALDAADAEAIAKAEAWMDTYGYTLEYFINYYQNVTASIKYEEWLMQDAPEITEAEIQAEYESLVEESRETYAADAALYEAAAVSGLNVWYLPDGYRAVLQIMLASEGADDAARLASVRNITDDIYARLDAGESFETLLAEYGTDANFASEAMLQSGYQIHQNSIIWDAAVVEAAFSDKMQKPGDVSDPFVCGEYVYIQYYLRDVPGGAVELTDSTREVVHETIYAQRLSEKQAARIAELKAAAEIIYSE